MPLVRARSGPSAPRTPRRSCGGGSRSSPSSSSRRRPSTLVSFAIGPFRLPAGGPARRCRRRFSGSSSSSPRRRACRAPSSPRRRRARASPCARPSRPTLVLAGKSLFNLAALPGDRRRHDPGLPDPARLEDRHAAGVAATMLAGGYGLAVVSTFLSALVARAGQRNVALRPDRVSPAAAAPAHGDRRDDRGDARRISGDAPAGPDRLRWCRDRRGVYAGRRSPGKTDRRDA